MCGVMGRISQRAGGGALDLSQLKHRGPDDRGQEQIGSAVLGHTRLSIIDLDGGHQPMSDVGGTATIVFNGEIYNHRELRGQLIASGHTFVTSSDTEVIVAAYRQWGVSGFARLRGMYAFALRDHLDGSTIIARDPFGIKPLFYLEDSDDLHFASELGALLTMIGAVPALDVTSILETLVHRYPIGGHSFYRGVKRLQPGAALVIRRGSGGAKLQSFADLPAAVEAEREEALLARTPDVRAKVIESVNYHAVSDVPVACFLSGGLDSSIVAERLSKLTKGPLKTYTVSFKGASSEESELPYAESVAAHIGAELREVEVTPADFAELAPVLSGTPNGPFSDPADIAMLKLSLAAKEDVKVVLSGEGSDEAFAGYPKYAADRFARLLGPVMRTTNPWLRRRGRLGIAVHSLAEPSRAPRWLRWFQNDAAPAAIISSLVGSGAETQRAGSWVEERVNSYPAAWSDLQRMQVLDLQSWLPNNLLHRGDFTTMQASVEQRVPFLDMELTPWAVAIPDQLKIRGLTGKVALRQAFAHDLPQRVVQRPKSGFRLPLGEWLNGDTVLRSMVHDHLHDPNASIAGLLDRRAIETMLSPGSLGTTGGAKLAWTTLCLELWLASIGLSPFQQQRKLPTSFFGITNSQ